MRGFWVLLRKEIREQFRTNKIIILAVVFLFFGLSLPVLTKYLPDIINSVPSTGGFAIEMPPAVSIDAILSYASNIAQLGVLIVVLLAMGSIAKETEGGTAALLLSKPVSRLSFITAKLTAESLNLLLGMLFGGVACWGCTLVLFGDVATLGFVYQMLLMVLFLIFCLAVTLFFSSLMKNQIAAGGLAITTILATSLLAVLPNAGRFLPGGLISWGNQLVTGQSMAVEWGALAITLTLIALCVYGAWLNLRRKEL